MKRSIIAGVLGFLIGAVTGGYFVGIACSRRYKKLLEAAQEKHDEDIDEEPADDEKGHSEPLRATVAPIENKRSDEYDENVYERLSQKYRSPEFDAHFADRAHPTDDEPDENIADEGPDIRMIDRETFYRDLNTGREWAEYTYYQQDSLLVDSGDEPVFMEEEVIGEAGVEIIDDTKEDYLYFENVHEDKLIGVNIDHETMYLNPDWQNAAIIRDMGID